MLSTIFHAALSHFDSRLESPGQCCHLVVNHGGDVAFFHSICCPAVLSTSPTTRRSPGKPHPQLHGHAAWPLTGTQPGPHRPHARVHHHLRAAGRRWWLASPWPGQMSRVCLSPSTTKPVLSVFYFGFCFGVFFVLLCVFLRLIVLGVMQLGVAVAQYNFIQAQQERLLSISQTGGQTPVWGQAWNGSECGSYFFCSFCL